MAKVTVFECYGTGDFAGNVTNMVRGSIDPDYFNYVGVTDYPNSLDNYGNSVSQGVASVLAKVAATPGKIVLTGVSQGAQIMGNVYNSLKNGPRAADIVGVYLVGNPIRQAGRAFPGANPIPAGHGVAPVQYRMTNTPDLVWEFANPGDPVCTIGDDAAGLALTASFGQQMQNIKPASSDFQKNIAAAMNFLGLIATTTGIGQGGIINAILQGLNFLGKHSYFAAFKPIAGDPRSGRQIICDHLNTVIAPLHASAPEPPTPRLYGLVAANGTPRPAAAVVRRWNDKKVRHTVYTVCGTTADGWGLMNQVPPEIAAGLLELARTVTGNRALTQSDIPTPGNPLPSWGASFDAAVARTLDPEKFNWVPISYPAASPITGGNIENDWIPQLNTTANSAKMGVNELIDQIASTPGTFALVGMSQGSVVISQVLKAMLPGGRLQGRFRDCIAGLAYGNPSRAAGTGLPGVAPAPGAGVISLGYTKDGNSSGLQPVKNQLPTWWWEFALPGDFFASAPMDTTAGPTITPAIQALYHSGGSLAYDAGLLSITFALMGLVGTSIQLVLNALAANGIYGAANLVDFFGSAEAKALLSSASQQSAAALQVFAQYIYQQVGVLDVQASISTGTPVIVPSNYYPNGNPHVRYGVDKPPTVPTGLAGVNSNSTYVDIGIAYLNARGAAVAPR